MRLVTIIEKTNADTRSAGSRGPARRSRVSDCNCGQQLDMCARAHCPRCGRSIHQD
jgi:hypothetical protein